LTTAFLGSFLTKIMKFAAICLICIALALAVGLIIENAG
jgi:hypothetical protein